MIPSLLLPFNLMKGVMNAALVFILYKPVTTALSRARIIDRKVGFKFNKNTIIMLIIGIVLLLASITVFMLVLNGEFQVVR